jgi:hypothetical protein
MCEARRKARYGRKRVIIKRRVMPRQDQAAARRFLAANDVQCHLLTLVRALAVGPSIRISLISTEPLVEARQAINSS